MILDVCARAFLSGSLSFFFLKSSQIPAMIVGRTSPVFLSQNHANHWSGSLFHPQLKPKKLFVSLAVPEIDHSSSGTAMIATPAPNSSHSFQRDGRIAKQKAVTTNKAARECRCTSGSIPARRPRSRGERDNRRRGADFLCSVFSVSSGANIFQI